MTIDEKYKFDIANRQRFIALKSSFEFIRSCAEPCLAPDEFFEFEKLEKRLIEIYGKDVIDNLPEHILKGGYDGTKP